MHFKNHFSKNLSRLVQKYIHFSNIKLKYLCECFCCSLSVPFGVCSGSFRANITVEKCPNCTTSLCQSTYISSCPRENGYANSTCSEKTFSSSSSGDSLFSPIYSVFIIPMVVIQMILIYL